jgi:hypothetical protein
MEDESFALTFHNSAVAIRKGNRRQFPNVPRPEHRVESLYNFQPTAATTIPPSPDRAGSARAGLGNFGVVAAPTRARISNAPAGGRRQICQRGNTLRPPYHTASPDCEL